MQRRRPRPGDKVVITKSWHSDIVPGMEGVVEKRMPGGYAVDITGVFSDATGRRKLEKRCVYFGYLEVKRAASPVDDAEENCIAGAPS